MSSSEAKLHLCLKEGVFEISGSELFVTQQIENFKESILQLVLTINTQEKTYSAAFDNNNGQSSPNSSIQQVEAMQKPNTPTFPRVLHIEDKEVRIIKKMPGSNNSQKSSNTALVYLWGKKSVGIESVSFQEIRELCQQQGCLDASNFSAMMQGMKEDIIVDGKKGSSAKTCKLTLPGSERAELLLKELNGE